MIGVKKHRAEASYHFLNAFYLVSVSFSSSFSSREEIFKRIFSVFILVLKIDAEIIFSKAQKLLILGGSEGFTSCEYVNSLDSIGFTLSIISVKKIRSVSKAYIAKLYISKALGFKFFYYHCSVILRGTTI